MENTERINFLMTMLQVADTQVRVLERRVKVLEEETMRLQFALNEKESQLFGGKIK
jgi:hypothetical protein